MLSKMLIGVPMTRQHAVVSMVFRSLYTAAGMKYLPHAFDQKEAVKRIQQFDKDRPFAPKIEENNDLVVVSEDNPPLKKVLLPICGINAYISSTAYKVEYGFDRIIPYRNEKGNLQEKVITNWYYAEGMLGRYNYTQGTSYNMTVYAGSVYYDETVEKALETNLLQSRLIEFNKDTLDGDIVVDTFNKSDPYLKKTAETRIYEAEYYRTTTEIQIKYRCHHVRIIDLKIISELNLQKSMLPAYILKHAHSPIRVLSAISPDDYAVYGAAPTCDKKVGSAAGVLSMLLTFILPPPVSIPARAMLIMGATAFSSVYSHYRLSIKDNLQRRRIEELNRENEALGMAYFESKSTYKEAKKSNQSRKKVEESNHTTEKSNKKNAQPEYKSKPELLVDEIWYKVLGLSTDVKPSESDVIKATTVRLHKVHPDKGGSNAALQEVLNARRHFLQALGTKRSFSTYVLRRNDSSFAKKEAPDLQETDSPKP